MARLMVEIVTRTPVLRSHIWQWRSKVASSFSSSCLHKAFLCSRVARIRRLRPVENLGERSLPSRLILSQRFSVVREMEKVSTTSLLGIPRSTAATARGHRSHPEVLRVDLHARHPYTGPLYSQTALVAADQ